MADLRQVRTRLATAHTALTNAASILDVLNAEAGETTELNYMQREMHKLLGRLEALDAGLAHLTPDHRRTSRRKERSKEGSTEQPKWLPGAVILPEEEP